MPSSARLVFFGGHAFHVTENVYEPAEDSFLFAENLAVKSGAAVLDVGTGCGILGIIAAAKASRVVAVDINPFAVRCAKENATVNRVDCRMVFVQEDLFASIRSGEQFDYILFNAPYLPSDQTENVSWLRCAWSGGPNGRQVIDRFICDAPEYLRGGGCILLMQSTLANIGTTLGEFEEKGLKATVMAKRDLPFFETIVLVKAEKRK